MRRVSKKTKKVKGQKAKTKAPGTLRYTLYKDSLNRRYAVDKRTGKRVSVSKAVKERVKRQKTITVFRGIEPKKKTVRTKQPTKKKILRSEAAKKGWETRRKKVKPSSEPPSRPGFSQPKRGYDPFAIHFPGPPLIPLDLRMVTLGGIADRAERFPKVQEAASRAWVRMQADAYARSEQLAKGEQATLFQAKLFDSKHGEGAADLIRFQYFARAMDIQDIDQIVEELIDIEDENYSARELYTLYFSPDVA